MNSTYTKMDLVFIVLSLIFSIIGIAMISDGEGDGWGVFIFGGLCMVVFSATPFVQVRARKSEVVEVSDWGIRRKLGNEINEAVSWQDLWQVSIETTSSGPAVEDLFFLLHGSANKGVLIPHGVAVDIGLLEELQKRLPGFDNMTLVKAMGSTDDQVFVVWRAPETQQTEEVNQQNSDSD